MRRFLRLHSQGNTPLFYKETALKKYIDPKNLRDFRNSLDKKGSSLATLNGSFDLLHAGHLQIIYEASLQADLLLVALNSDSSIKKYKSKDRPIIGLENRLQMMAALGFVDYVTWFEETDPIKILTELRPHVHVNGPEYGADCIESAVVKEGGGRIHIAQFVPGLSTSEIVKKIKDLS